MQFNEKAAQLAHEANRAYCQSLGDYTQMAWDNAQDWQRESALVGVQMVLEGKSPEELHQSWCEYKLNDGWTYGEVKDAEKKTHPCLVSYDQLPAEQRIKDILFRSVVLAALAVEIL